MRRGDPGLRSPADVCGGDKDYTMVTAFDGQTYPSTIQVVVRHNASGTLWSCFYRIDDDTSDSDQPTGWFEVEERPVTKIEYRRKK